MEALQENVFLYNAIAGIVILVLFLLILKFVESLAKTLFIFIGVVIVGYGLVQFFPNVTEPIARFIGIGPADEEQAGTEATLTDSESNTYFDTSAHHNSQESYPNSGRTYNSEENYDGRTLYDSESSTYDSNSMDENSYNYQENHSYDGSYPYDEGDPYDEVDTYH